MSKLFLFRFLFVLLLGVSVSLSCSCSGGKGGSRSSASSADGGDDGDDGDDETPDEGNVIPLKRLPTLLPKNVSQSSIEFELSDGGSLQMEVTVHNPDAETWTALCVGTVEIQFAGTYEVEGILECKPTVTADEIKINLMKTGEGKLEINEMVLHLTEKEDATGYRRATVESVSAATIVHEKGSIRMKDALEISSLYIKFNN